MTEVYIRRQWNDWQKGKVYLDTLEGLKWDRISGGVQARAPQLFIHGYIWCNDIIEGEIAHTCSHGPPPHRIKVCVVMKDNSKETWAELLEIVGAKPKKNKGGVIDGQAARQ